MEKEREFLRGEVARCLGTGAWERVPQEAARFVSRAFLVPKPNGKFRLVIDLRFLNQHCQAWKCRFEGLSTLRRLAQQGDWMFSFDLQDGYHHIPIAREHRKYFQFALDLGDGPQYFHAAALPFGWLNSPYVFTKCMRPMVAHLRCPVLARAPSGPQRATPSQVGARVLPYLDDFLFLTRTHADALRLRERVASLLERLGLARHPTKGHWEPAQQLEHLGLAVDTQRGLYLLTPKRSDKLRSFAKSIIAQARRSARWVPARTLSSFAGLAQSVYLAVPPARFFLRSLHDALATRKNWGARVRLDRQALADLEWWTNIPAHWNGRAIWVPTETAELHCDASGQGWGAMRNNRVPAYGMWSRAEAKLHITHKELLAVRLAVQTFLPHLRGRRCLLHEDNQAVVAMLTHATSRSPELMQELRRLWWLLDVNDIRLRPVYIRSAANVWADRLSRMVKAGQTIITPELFRELETRYGPHTVDAFATPLTAHCARFWALEEIPGAEAVGPMHQSWRAENLLLVPPVRDLLAVAQRLREEPHQGATVVVPYWPASPWFRELMALATEWERRPPGAFQALPQSPVAMMRGDESGPHLWPMLVVRVPARA